MTTELDLRGLKCPLPVLKTRKAAKGMAGGDVLAVLVTDPGAPDDLAHFCEVSGNRLLGATPQADYVRVEIEIVPQ